jgi:hypothetical protein
VNLIQEIKETLRMEVRPNSAGPDYLEAVFQKSDLESLNSLLRKHLGTDANVPGKEANLPAEIQKMIDSIGGVWPGQPFFYKQDNRVVIYAVLWPWESNPEKITLKSGLWKID